MRLYRVVFVFMVLCAGSVHAKPQSTGPTVDVQLFHPTAGALNFFTTESGRVNSHLGVNAGLLPNWCHQCLGVQVVRADDSKDSVGAVVKDRIDTNVLLSLGLFDIGEIGVVVPLVHQSGLESSKFLGANVSIPGSLRSFSLGDVRVIPKVQAFSVADGLLSAAVVGTVIVPSAGGAPYAGENNIVIAPSLALSTDTGAFRAGLNVGYRYRDRTRVDSYEGGPPLLVVDDEVYAKAAVAFDLLMGNSSAPFEIVGEVFGHTPAVNAFAVNNKGFVKEQQLSRTSLEGDLGVRWILFDQAILTAGVGAGLTKQGYGQPKPRAFVGFTYYTGQFAAADADKDGVEDALDKCPDEKEDRDNFEDRDGCPDHDNDDDGVLDEDDQCPDEPEGERDGFNDEDGCPDPDNDEDGLIDEGDRCPVEAEDKDGFEDEDGCPDLDNDGDGVADKVDKCPNDAEDVDGFKDIDGCPDEDNDQDGLPDLGDLCPNHAEDKDGVADDDGCPEDNDNDGIPDADDKCPNKAEVYNGVDDEDGCPEKVKIKSLVKVTEEKIEIKEKVFFKTGSAKILKKSNKLLDQVASVLKNYKHIKKVRVEGHTDSRGSRRRNMKLSRERAQSVRDYLIQAGVAPERLDAKGFGPDKPIASNRTRRGRENNRRVEFVIVEQKPIGEDVSDAEPVIEMDLDEGLPASDEGAEPVFDLGGDEASQPAPGSEEPTFDLEIEGEKPSEPPPAAEPEKKGKRKGKKKKKKKKKKEEKDPGDEIEFDF